MLDLLYDLSPEEGIDCLDGHLLVLLLDDDAVSHAVAERLERKVAGLDDASEFRMSIVSASQFRGWAARASELPALLHFSDGKLRSEDFGVDDCLEFFDEFVEANRCRKNVKR